jgi:uncharacterized protein (TIGR03435 family)
MPGWVMSDRYDIEARAKSDPGKDGMRMMMRALLAERFKFAFHDETRQIPVLAMALIKPAMLGPQLWPHPKDAPCSAETVPDRMFCTRPPAICPNCAMEFIRCLPH